MARMRLLFVDVNLNYINPTVNLMPILVQCVSASVNYYGPGFVSNELIENGLISWIDNTGPYDAVIFGPNVPILVDDESLAAERAVTFQRKYTYKIHSDLVSYRFFKDVHENIKKINCSLRIVTGLSFDYYAATQSQVDKIVESNLVVMSPNFQFVQRLGDLPGFAKMEKHYIKKKNILSNAWHEFAARNPEKFITALHYVSPNEFCYTSIDLRKYLIAIPGTEYYLRRKAIGDLKRSGISVASKWYFNAFKIANKIGIPAYSNATLLAMYNHFYRLTLYRSRYVYTARGGFGIPVRKFFEIPAAGSLLICNPCVGYEELGFVSGENFIYSDGNDLAELVRRCDRDYDVQSIADAGRKLVATKHSVDARAAQIRECIGALLDRTYAGSEWKSGNFYILRKGQCVA